MPAALVTEDLAKAFGANVAVGGLSLVVPQGSCFGLIGPNGSGKTTTMRMCAGLLRPDSGRASVDGVDVWVDPVEARRRIGVVPDPLLLFERLSGIEQLVHTGLLRNLGRAVTEERSWALLEVLGLTGAAGEVIGDYSHGMRKKLSLAAAMLHRPALLLLDEPFEGVDPVSALTVRRVLDRYRHAGGTVVVSSHVMEVLQRFCDRVAIIDRGQVLAAGPLDELAGDSTTLEEAFIAIVGESPTDARLLDWLDADVTEPGVVAGRTSVRPARAEVAAHSAPPPLGPALAARRIVELKVALLTALARTSIMHAVGLAVGTAVAAVVGGAMGVGIAVGARQVAWLDPVLVVGATALPVVAVLFGAMVGAEGTIDPRRLAVLPLSNSALSAGTLTAALVGPAGLAGMLLAAGTVAGYVPAGPGALIVVAGVVGLATLTVTCARLATNVLGMLAGGRGRRFANLLTASAGLLLAAGAQLISFLMTRPTGWWENAADAMAWTPTAQLARAVTQAGTSPGAATAHLLAGLAVLPVLFVLHGRTFRLFLVATPGVGAASKRARRQRRPYPRWLPESPAWTVAVRSVRLKLREPRLLTGLVAALALAIGGSLAVVLSSGDGRNPTMVLLGTAAQFAVIFDNQNVFGTDGRALGADLIANGDLSHLVRGKRLAALFSGVPPVVVVPPMVAALTGGWSLVPIGLLLGAGAAVLASGVAMFVSVNAPMAQPESSNPFASADAGQGCLSGLFLGFSLALMGIVTIPPALVIGYFGPGRPALVVALVAVSLAVDVALGALAERTATRMLTGRADRVLDAVTPT